MNRVVGRSAIMLILILALAAGTVFFVGEYFINSGDWVLQEGSPHVYTDYSSVSGLITDRNGILLMDTTDGRVYTENVSLRSSIIHWLGDRQGNIYAPVISHYAAQMTGHNPINGLYVYGNDGGKVKLTLSAEAQLAAMNAMGDYKGTIAVYNYRTGEILCAVTTPNFDPDNLPDIAADTEGKWEGAYVNRFLKSTYIPGSIFKIVTAAAALETIPDIQQQTFVCNGITEYGIDRVTCLKAHGELNLTEAFMNSCNCAFAAIADQLGGEMLQHYAQLLGVTGNIGFDGVTSTPGSIVADGEAEVMVAWSAIGQHRDQINPCQFMTMVGAIAAGGNGAVPHIVASIDGGGWGTYTAQTVHQQLPLSENTLVVLRSLMRNNVENFYGDENFGGLTVCAKSGTAEVGGDEIPNAMFTGFVTDEEYPLAFIAVVENGGYGRPVCMPIVAEVLAACKSVMDRE
jgi:peptidoglycan glycosyltransferase